MTLKDFEKDISSTLLERGQDYFVNECVDNLDEDACGLWMAQVYGSDTYTVEVRTHKTKIKGWDCNCPYDHGPICKHVIAVFYAIADDMESEKKSSGKAVEKVKKKNKVKEIFKKTSKDDLQQFIKSQFRKDFSLKNIFIAHFAELLNEDEGIKYRTIVNNLYKAAQGPYGFIDYNATRTLTDPLFDLTQKAEELLGKNNIAEALEICKTLIEEVPVFVQSMDDSDGSAGDVMEQAFDTFYNIADQVPPLIKDDLFIYCLSEYPKEKYHDFGFEYRFLDVFPLLITTADQEEQFFDLINQQIEEERGKSYSDYSIIQLINAKIDYLQLAKREDEAQALIEANKNYADFRGLLVSQAISRKDFNTAKELCKEGIVIAKKEQHLGTENSWYVKILEIAEKTKNILEIRKWSEKLYFDNHFSKEYYLKLKSTYSDHGWPEKCEEIINKLKGKEQRGGYVDVNALANIFIKEKYWDRLLKLLQINSKQIFFVDSYADKLKNQFPAEILALYEKGVKEYAISTGRNIYRDVADLLKKMKKIKGGKEKVNAIIQYFRNLYNMRPAMMEILNKNFPETIPQPKGKDVQKRIDENLGLF